VKARQLLQFLTFRKGYRQNLPSSYLSKLPLQPPCDTVLFNPNG
jgi:hypothetical protein